MKTRTALAYSMFTERWTSIMHTLSSPGPPEPGNEPSASHSVLTV